MQLRCFTVSENRFTRFGCVKFWAMKIQLRNLFDKSICWSLVAVFSTSWWLYMRQVESNVRCCDSPNSRRHWKRADRRVPEEEQSYWCVEVAVIGDPYGMSIDMSASYLVLFNTLISSELKVDKTRVLLCKRLSGQCRDVYMVPWWYTFTCTGGAEPYLIIVADAADAVSVNFSGRCKFLQI